ncbi:MAG TPA: chemotaxis protein CheD [Bryobacteraceae bacterium]|nr:chemotaxis protein CheD [Bryobacteraceae bacterium]
MTSQVIGISDCAVTNDRDRSLITYALGSCIAIAIHDRVANVGGMLHFMLPDSTMNPAKAQANPWVFADTGIPRLFQQAYQCGADKRRLSVYLLGGAQIVNSSDEFNIGKRNHLAARKILWKAGIVVHGETVGGNLARTVRLEVATGKVFWRTPGEAEREMVPVVKGVR